MMYCTHGGFLVYTDWSGRTHVLCMYVCMLYRRRGKEESKQAKTSGVECILMRARACLGMEWVVEERLSAMGWDGKGFSASALYVLWRGMGIIYT